MSNKPLLQVKGLHTTFTVLKQPLPAVRGVDLHVDEGEILGIVGESGSGKSVTMKSIIRMLPRGAIVTADSVSFLGEELLSKTESEMRALRGDDITMIFQDPMTSLNPLKTVGFHIAEVLQRHRGLTGQAARAEALALLDKVGVPSPEERLDQYPHEFSGGMRQRVLIAMALACKPKLLIADEPTTALDVTIQAQILDLIGELQKSENMSVVLITHDLGVVASLCHRVCVMYGGMIMEEGSLDDIFYRTAHPYTEALLGSIPARALENGTRLIPIKGYAPSLLNLPPGCPFAPRCPKKTPICDDGIPDMVPIAPGHCVRCVLYREVNHG